MARQDWNRLARYLIAARTELGYHRRIQLARASGINDRLLAGVENCERTNFDRATLARFEQAYGWAPGSVDEVLAGGEPTPRQAARSGHDADAPRRIEDAISVGPDGRFDYDRAERFLDANRDRYDPEEWEETKRYISQVRERWQAFDDLMANDRRSALEYLRERLSRTKD